MSEVNVVRLFIASLDHAKVLERRTLHSLSQCLLLLYKLYEVFLMMLTALVDSVQLTVSTD